MLSYWRGGVQKPVGGHTANRASGGTRRRQWLSSTRGRGSRYNRLQGRPDATGQVSAQITVQGKSLMIASAIESLLIGAVVVCFLALVFLIASPEADLSTSVLRRYPELTRFAFADQARRALRGASKRLSDLRL
ncbi:MAG: hypothetical protein AMXMBFR13_39460 [Phycisphaerae bacterium]